MMRDRKFAFYRRLQFTAMALLVAATSGCSSIEPEQTFSRAEFSDATIEARYVEVMGAGAFASHTIRFYEVKNGHQRLLLQTELKNDGKNPKG
ncbi:MAG: hypothetical protein KDB03_24825, partial [Planctomycetales bacterium]|nr:hypothetical protein [Planctomycetales bacterium]